MSYYSTLWTKLHEEHLDKYDEIEVDSTTKSGIELPPRNLSQRWRRYSQDAKRRVFERFSKWCPKTTATSNLFIYLKTDQTFPEFVLNSIIGFFGGIVLTYLCFVFFVFQLSISLIHATIISSIIGVLLTFGLAFSYRIRCLVFLLIPQLFSRVGRYTLTCYALVLILTGPATNTLKNSEVLTESMACTQEQIKTNVKQATVSANNPLSSMKDSIKLMMGNLDRIANKLDGILVKINRLVNAIVDVLQESYSWLQLVFKKCNEKFGTPFEHCIKLLTREEFKHKKSYSHEIPALPNTSYILKAVCTAVNSNRKICEVADFAEVSFAATIKRRLRIFTDRVQAMFYIKLHMHHSYTSSSNTSRSPSQVTAGIVTEIRNRADPLLTWLSWSSCVTSFFLLLIIFRAKYYQRMFESRSRFDNRYITKELRDLNTQKLQEGKETVLPLNRRERAKYVTTTSLRLVASERVHLTRSIVFMAITTFKLMIHVVADYSLYWVLITIRYHGKRQSNLLSSPTDGGVIITGTGLLADILRSIFKALTIPLLQAPSSLPCLPDPYPPDLKRYTQIGILIFLLWFFALFEPYGLRLRHLIMGHYRPERAKARAVWLYNHILRTRGSFMKFARRKLHKEYKYLPEQHLTFRYWLLTHIPFQFLRYILGISKEEPKCLLCHAKEVERNLDSILVRCENQDCPGIFCNSCFSDIGRLCTICLTPVDYGDFSDISLEKGSSEDSEESSYEFESEKTNKLLNSKYYSINFNNSEEHHHLLGDVKNVNIKKPRCYSFTRHENTNQDIESILDSSEDELENTFNKFKKSKAIDLKQFSVQGNDVIVGYVFQNHFHNDKLLNSPLSLFKSSSYMNLDKKPFHNKKSNYDYGTFNEKFKTEIKNGQKEPKKRKNKNFRKRNITKLYIKIKKIYRKKLKSRSAAFKKTRSNSQKYYKRLEVRYRFIRMKSKQYFIPFSITPKKTKEDKLKNSHRKETTQTIGVPYFKTGFNKNCYKHLSFLQTHHSRKNGDIKKTDVHSQEDISNDEGKREKSYNNINRKLTMSINNEKIQMANGSMKNKTKNEEKKQFYSWICLINFKKLICFHLSQLKSNYKDRNKKNSRKMRIKTSLKYLSRTLNYKSRKKQFINVKKSGKENREIRKENEIARQFRIYKFLKDGYWIESHLENACTIKESANIKCDLEKVKSNVKENFKQTEEYMCMDHISCGHHGNQMCRSSSDKVYAKENIGYAKTVAKGFTKNRTLKKEDNKQIDYSNYFLLSNNPPHEPENNTSDNHLQLTASVKSCSLKNVKLYISNKFLHLQFRKPLTLLRSLLSSMSLFKNKRSTADVPVISCGASVHDETSKKVVPAHPLVRSCSCQCEIIKNTISNSSNIHGFFKSGSFSRKSTNDKEIQTQKIICTCTYCAMSNETYSDCKVDGTCNGSNKKYGSEITKKDFTSITSESSNSTGTDETLYSYFTIDYIDETPVRKEKRMDNRFKVNVVTKLNQSTATDPAELCNVSTITNDWWSPIVEKKEIGYKRPDKKHNKIKKSAETSIDGRFVTFESQAHIIPDNSIVDNSYILSPSRYLLESQKYYNELYSPNFNAPHLLTAFMVSQKRKVNVTANRMTRNKPKTQ